MHQHMRRGATRLAATAATGLLGLGGLLLAAPAHAYHGDTNCNHADPQCVPPTEDGPNATAAAKANPNAATGMAKAAERAPSMPDSANGG